MFFRHIYLCFFSLFFLFVLFFFFKQKTAYEVSACLVGSEMCIGEGAGVPVVPGVPGVHVVTGVPVVLLCLVCL